MLALTRPLHYVLFALALTGLFGVTFQVTQAVHESPPEEPVEVLAFKEPEEPLPFVAPLPLPDLRIEAMSARECVSAEPDRPGGLLTLRVRNEGEGEVRGVRLFAGLDVHNVDAGVFLQFERDVAVERMASGEEVTIQIAYGFPVRDSVLLGPVEAQQPVPGSYRLEVRLDRPSMLSVLGEGGIVEESDESNNVAETRTTGVASGVC